MTDVTSLEITSVVAVTSASAALVSSTLYVAQVVLTPDNVWIPIGLVFGLVGLSVWTTVRAVRMFDKMTSDISQIKKFIGMGDDK